MLGEVSLQFTYIAGHILGAKRHGNMIKTWVYSAYPHWILKCSLATRLLHIPGGLSAAEPGPLIRPPAGWSGAGMLLSSDASDNLLLFVTVEGPVVTVVD